MLRISRAFVWFHLPALLLGTVACVSAGNARADTPNEKTEATTSITGDDVKDALVKVKADPNLAKEKMVPTLHWQHDKQKRKTHSFGWLGDLFGFIAETGRVIVWLIIAVAIALLVLAIVRIVRSIHPSPRAAPFDAPTHVRDLDIRPESLPDDIGAAVLALWEKGEHRPALALLYRGLLSRLVHVHEIQIRNSSTEGDCLQLAAQRLKGDRGSYVAQVVGVWQRAVYGGQSPQTEDVRVMCLGFADALNKPSASAAL